MVINVHDVYTFQSPVIEILHPPDAPTTVAVHSLPLCILQYDHMGSPKQSSTQGFTFFNNK